jgi:hypothetical protein
MDLGRRRPLLIGHRRWSKSQSRPNDLRAGTDDARTQQPTWQPKGTRQLHVAPVHVLDNAVWQVGPMTDRALTQQNGTSVLNPHALVHFYCSTTASTYCSLQLSLTSQILKKLSISCCNPRTGIGFPLARQLKISAGSLLKRRVELLPEFHSSFLTDQH